MDVPQPLKQVVSDWYAARDAADADGLAMLYLMDGVIVLPTGVVLRGRNQIRDHYSVTLKMGKRNPIRFGTKKYFVEKKMAHVTGTATSAGGAKYSFVDVLIEDADGKFRFAFSSWTVQ